MTVQEMFEVEKIDLDFVNEKMSDGGSYWTSCGNFLEENWSRAADTMSSKQQKWLSRILDDCVEKRLAQA